MSHPSLKLAVSAFIVLLVSTIAAAWLLPHESSPARTRPPSVHTDAGLCIARCHRAGMRVVQFDGAQPYYNGPWRGCVCAEAPEARP